MRDNPIFSARRVSCAEENLPQIRRPLQRPRLLFAGPGFDPRSAQTAPGGNMRTLQNFVHTQQSNVRGSTPTPNGGEMKRKRVWYVFGFIKKTSYEAEKNVFTLHIHPELHTHLWLRCYNFFSPSKKNSFGCTAIKYSQRVNSAPTYYKVDVDAANNRKTSCPSRESRSDFKAVQLAH
jgi:hypothetical protein